MASKELAKKHEKEKETAISPFVVFQTPVSEIRDAVLANLGDNGVSAQDFERVKIPAGGGTAWALQSLDGEELVKELAGIIVAWRDTRAPLRQKCPPAAGRRACRGSRPWWRSWRRRRSCS